MNENIQRIIFINNLDRKNADKIIDECTKIINKNPKNIMAYVFRAMAELKLGNKEDASIDCETAISLNPTNYIDCYIITIIKLEFKKTEEAINWLNKATDLKNNDTNKFKSNMFAYWDISCRFSYYLQIGDYKKALDASIFLIKKLVHIPKLASTVHLNVGTTLIMLGYYKLALEELNKALTSNFNENKDITYFNIASLKYRLEQYEEAINYCNKAIEENCNFALAYAYRGLIKTKLNLFDKAIEDYSQAIKLDDKDFEIYFVIAKAKYLMGLYNETIDNCNKSIELNTTPNNSRQYIYIGMAKYKLQQYNDAVEFYNKTIELNPQEKEVRDYIVKLKNDLASVGIVVPDLKTYFTKNIEYTYTKDDYKKIRKELNVLREKKFVRNLWITIGIIAIFIISTTLLMNLNIPPKHLIPGLLCFFEIVIGLVMIIIINISIKDTSKNPYQHLIPKAMKNIKSMKRVNLLFENNHIILNNKFLKEYYRYSFSIKDFYEVKETENYICVFLLEEVGGHNKYPMLLFALPKNIFKDETELSAIISAIKIYCDINDN